SVCKAAARRHGRHRRDSPDGTRWPCGESLLAWECTLCRSCRGWGSQRRRNRRKSWRRRRIDARYSSSGHSCGNAFLLFGHRGIVTDLPKADFRFGAVEPITKLLQDGCDYILFAVLITARAYTNRDYRVDLFFHLPDGAYDFFGAIDSRFELENRGHHL